MGRLVPFLIALGVGLILTPASILVGVRTGFVDVPAAPAGRRAAPVVLKIHARPVSQLGGVAVVAAALAGLAAAGEWPSAVVVGGVAVATVVGLVDDAWSLPPWVRVVALGGVAAALALGGAAVAAPGIAGGVAAAVAVFACANAVNLLDGQDGLAGGLAAFAALGVAAVSAIAGGEAAIGVALAAALLAFLWWNREPARVFLGNGGAYGVGVLLALAAIDATRRGPAALAGVVLCLAVFEGELAVTIVRRLRGRGALTEGDRDHSYDVLAGRLRSRRRSTWWFWTAGATCAALGTLVALQPLPGGIVAALVLASAVPVVRRLPDHVEVRR